MICIRNLIKGLVVSMLLTIDGSIRSPILHEDTTMDDETCGIQPCCSSRKRIKLRFLQRFATPKLSLFFLCCAGITQGFLLSGLYSVVVSTLEKRFHLLSTETGFIASSYDISSLLSVLLITYYGGRGSKPLWIGWGVFLMGIGCLVFSLPHFLAPSYLYGEETHNVCNSSAHRVGCTESNLRNYMGVLVIAQLLNGIGGTTIYTLGVTYLDENVEQQYSSLYHGVYFSSGVIGPAFGFLLGGRFLTIFTDLSREVDINESSPLWVGAWWLGFLVGGVVAIAIALPILLYPKQLPNTAHLRLNREAEMHGRLDDEDGKLKNLAWTRSVLQLLTNPAFVLVTVALSIEAMLTVGVTTFGPKYLESMFALTPTQAATYFGILAITAGAFGQLLGGVVVAKAKLSVAGILKMCLCASVLALCTVFVFSLACDDIEFAGANRRYTWGEEEMRGEEEEMRGEEEEGGRSNFTSQCNSLCECSTDSFDPVCGVQDHVTYFSPCFAGCARRADDSTYDGCACVRDPASNVTSGGGDVTSGKCSTSDCGGMSLFLGIFFFSIFFSFMCATPAIQAILRVVPFRQRSFAVGMKFVFVRLLGSIPGPILFGRVLDLACLVWSTECGSSGSCKLYRNSDLSSHIVYLAVAIKATVVLLFAVALKIYKPHAGVAGADAMLRTLAVDGVMMTSSAAARRHRPPAAADDGVGYRTLLEEDGDWSMSD